ncbi:MAG: hypothetical protein WDW38_003176 [Sanguina aurantia]
MAGDPISWKGWEISVLFIGFLLILLVWESMLGLITFLGTYLSSASVSKVWIDRVKDEVLGVGVISLVLIFIEPEIAGICYGEKDNSFSLPALPAGESAPVQECPEGQKALFPHGSIGAAHYLLFFVAVIHIVQAYVCFTCTQGRFRCWSRWELVARTGEAIDGAEAPSWARQEDRRITMPCQPLVPLRGLQRLWRGLTGNLDQGLYMKMREMFKRRSTLSLVHSNLLASLHFTNVCEQAMEMEMASLHSHTWLQTLFIAVFAFHPTVVYHQVWITFLAVVVQIAFIIHMEIICRKVCQMEDEHAARDLQDGKAGVASQTQHIQLAASAGTADPTSQSAPAVPSLSGLACSPLMHDSRQDTALQTLPTSHSQPTHDTAQAGQSGSRAEAGVWEGSKPPHVERHPGVGTGLSLDPAPKRLAAASTATRVAGRRAAGAPTSRAAGVATSTTTAATSILVDQGGSGFFGGGKGGLWGVFGGGGGGGGGGVDPIAGLGKPESAAKRMQREMAGLFMLRQSAILVWVTQIMFVENSLSMVLSVFYLIQYEGSLLNVEDSGNSKWIWGPLLAVNAVFVLYIGWVAIPMHTLVTTTCTRKPRALFAEIQRSKKAQATSHEGADPPADEQAGAGKLVKRTSSMKQRRREEEDPSAVHNYFVNALAAHAGVIVAHHTGDNAVSRLKLMGPVLHEYAQVWLWKSQNPATLLQPTLVTDKRDSADASAHSGLARNFRGRKPLKALKQAGVADTLLPLGGPEAVAAVVSCHSIPPDRALPHPAGHMQETAAADTPSSRVVHTHPTTSEQDVQAEIAVQLTESICLSASVTQPQVDGGCSKLDTAVGSIPQGVTSSTAGSSTAGSSTAGSSTESGLLSNPSSTPLPIAQHSPSSTDATHVTTEQSPPSPGHTAHAAQDPGHSSAPDNTARAASFSMPLSTTTTTTSGMEPACPAAVDQSHTLSQLAHPPSASVSVRSRLARISQSRKAASPYTDGRFVRPSQAAGAGAGARTKYESPHVLMADQAPFLNAFRALDTNNSGSISRVELYTGLHELGTHTTSTELDAMLFEIDMNNDRGIDFPEFLSFLVYSYFSSHFIGLSGVICKESLLAALKPLNVHVSEKEVTDMVQLANPEGDRRLGLRQFVCLFADVQVSSSLQLQSQQSVRKKKSLMFGRKGTTRRQQSHFMAERGTI